ncbi:hypothetical protein PI124_g17580 [Phytophthora idaei]|nr:hypothetical protein PI125_g23724 [Phytophthora idaei]KAG3138604.1 hypothetical protein PI126_g16836 [Phytophthora idaei]KAG3237433.1 hypothetical protein PI124_g17580 [Phytophthora idaei]
MERYGCVRNSITVSLLATLPELVTVMDTLTESELEVTLVALMFMSE